MDTKEICLKCGARCCKSTPAVLTDAETRWVVGHFGGNHVSHLHTKHGNIPVLAKGSDRVSCIFLENDECRIYENRPLTCHFFPILPRITNEEPDTVQLRLWFCSLTDKHELTLLDECERLALDMDRDTLDMLTSRLHAIGALKRKKLKREVRLQPSIDQV